ncbi:MAG: hypothetical protein LC776_03875 [Acidobacteria bacterium]|nr:hypothetical protein [Acidobacteriota bacterium]
MDLDRRSQHASLRTHRDITSQRESPGGRGRGPTCSTPTSTAELYDPVTGAWSATGSLNTARFSHTATLLRNGQVLVVGGYSGEVSLNSSELYDPATGTWRPTGSFKTIRTGGPATLLPNGMVLVVGWNLNTLIAELYDPALGTWNTTGAPSTTPTP